jgi:hypothetical protein
MVWGVDGGDVYVFSPSYAKSMADERQRTTLPAGVMRIKSGALEFDDTYYVNIEELTNGISFQRTWHIGGTKFMMLMYDSVLEPGKSMVANRLAIFDAATSEFKYIEGLPSSDIVSGFGKEPYVEGGKAYITISLTNDYPSIYVVDVATGVAQKGLSVQATTLDAVGRLVPIN